MGDVYFEVFVGVGFSRIAVQCEGLPLGGEMMKDYLVPF